MPNASTVMERDRSGRPSRPSRLSRLSRRRGLSRRATLAIWATCLVGGVGIGVLTDGGDGPASRRDEREPSAAERLVPPSQQATPAPSRDEGGTGAGERDASSRSGATRGRAGDDPGRPAGGSPATDGAAGSAGSGGPQPRLTEMDRRDVEWIIERVLPGVVVPPLDRPPAESTTTSEPPTSTTTTSEPPTSTTSTTDGSGGPGPGATTLPGIPGR